MKSMKPKRKKAVVSQKHGIRTHKTMTKAGMHPETISRLVDQKLLVPVSRGVYMTPETAITEHHDLAIVGARMPHGTVCLLSALRFHGMTTQIPREVWIAIGNRAASSRLATPPLRVIRLTGQSLSTGVEKHTVEGVVVRIYSPAKTVADCFKFRNKIGLDIAIESLKDFLRLKKGTVDDLWRFARIDRVVKVIQPYLEASV